MEAFLVEHWLGTQTPISVRDDASVVIAGKHVREVAAAQGLDVVAAGRLATISSELAQNQLRHARRGQLAALPIVRGNLRGVEIVAVDEGEGIEDPTRALEGVPRVTGSLGVGVAAARQLAHEIDFDVRVGEGTCVRARVFETAPPRRREIGIYGRAYRGERESGDHASFHREGDRLVLALCDGLGHGGPAREAAAASLRVFVAQHATTPQAIIDECHRTIGRTRGVVMAVAALEQRGGMSTTLELASVGNITTELVQPRTARRFGATSFVVGAPQRGWRAHVETAAVAPEETLLVFSDGVASRASIAEDLLLLREHPITIAHQMVARFGRDDDDVLMLVAR